MATRARGSQTKVPKRQTSLFEASVSRRAAKAPRPIPAPAAPPGGPKPVARPPGKKIWLSATGLETMRRCPRCFWVQYNLQIRQPEGIVSRLANRFDGVIKRYFDLYRGTAELPPIIAGQVEGRLEAPFQETYFVTLSPKYGFIAKLDECLVRPDGRFTPVDHKTASSDPNQRELIPAYQAQLDAYAFVLERNRKPSSGIGHLIYFYPGDGDRLHEGFPMQVTVKTLTTNPERVPVALEQAMKLLDGQFPGSAKDCPFCAYVETVKSF